MHSRAFGAAAAPARVVPGASSKTRPPAARPARAPRGWRDDSPLAPPEDARARKNKKKSRRERQRDRVFAEEVKGGDGDGKGDASSAVLRTVDLGQGKSVALYVPSDVAGVAGDRIARENLERFRDALYGAGDVVWPASIALARLVSHCPSLVAGKRVLEIGAGLGLVGNAAAKAGAAEVLMVDLDADVLQLARRSVPENIPEDPSLANVETLDWDGVPDDWPADRFDVVLAADVLYDDDAARGSRTSSHARCAPVVAVKAAPWRWCATRSRGNTGTRSRTRRRRGGSRLWRRSFRDTRGCDSCRRPGWTSRARRRERERRRHRRRGDG